MASASKPGKQSVKLETSGVKVSRIRRDPPPKVKEKVVDPDTVDRHDVVVGVIAFALAFFVIIVAFGSYSGWSLQQYKVELEASD